MRRTWTILLGLLGVVTTSCLGFTVERSSPGIGTSRNWSSPILDVDRRATIEKIWNGGIHPVEIENILRDSEINALAKENDEKCSSSSENPHRAKRSEDLLNPSNHLTSAERFPSELKESTILSSNSAETKSPDNTAEKIASNVRQSTIASSSSIKPKTLELSDGKIASSSKKIAIPSSNPTELKNSENEKIAPSLIKSTVVSSSSTEPKTAEKNNEKIVPSLKQSTIGSPISSETKNSEIKSEKSVDAESLKNVVLLLVDDAGTRQKNFFKNFEATNKFRIRGFVQNCRSAEFPKAMRFPSGDSVMSERKDEDCECDRFLRNNVASLLSWARRNKGMTTGAVSATNFSIPLSLGFDNPVNQFVKDFEDSDEINVMHRDNSRDKSDARDNWRLIDLEKQSSQSAPATIGWGSNWKQDNGNDGMWDVFDMFSRIRVAFFRILLESLGNLTGAEEDLNAKKSATNQPNLVELVTDAIRELKSVPNDKGFVLVAAASVNELPAAIDYIQHEISTKETLFLIAGTCSSVVNEKVPFFANGPSDRSFLEARTVWDLPGIIRGAMSKDCQDEKCKSAMREEEPRALPTIEISSLSQDIPHKRVARATVEEEASESTIDEKSTKETDEENDVTPSVGKRSGAQDIRVDNVTKFIGFFTSIVTMLALNSS